MKKIVISSAILEHWKPLELKIQLFVEFFHPLFDMKFTDTSVSLESLCVKLTTQRNFKQKAPSVRAMAYYRLLVKCT